MSMDWRVIELQKVAKSGQKNYPLWASKGANLCMLERIHEGRLFHQH